MSRRRNLDSHPGAETMRLLRTLGKEQGTTVVIVSHDERLREIPDRVLWLEDGRFKALQALVRDPTCGMLVDPYHAPDALDAEDDRLSFCSRGCRDEYLVRDAERRRRPGRSRHSRELHPSRGAEGRASAKRAPSRGQRAVRGGPQAQDERGGQEPDAERGENRLQRREGAERATGAQRRTTRVLQVGHPTANTERSPPAAPRAPWRTAPPAAPAVVAVDPT
jgi:energy-coupling factor transporter ATP-binding protein EcfA2